MLNWMKFELICCQQWSRVGRPTLHDWNDIFTQWRVWIALRSLFIANRRWWSGFNYIRRRFFFPLSHQIHRRFNPFVCFRTRVPHNSTQEMVVKKRESNELKMLEERPLSLPKKKSCFFLNNSHRLLFRMSEFASKHFTLFSSFLE